MSHSDHAWPAWTGNNNNGSLPDFDQWLGEINLFKQETQSELDDVARLLNLALTNRYDQTKATSLTANMNYSPEGAGGPLASIKSKLASQLRSQQVGGLQATRSFEAPQTATGPMDVTKPISVSDSVDAPKPSTGRSF